MDLKESEGVGGCGGGAAYTSSGSSAILTEGFRRVKEVSEVVLVMSVCDRRRSGPWTEFSLLDRLLLSAVPKRPPRTEASPHEGLLRLPSVLALVIEPDLPSLLRPRTDSSREVDLTGLLYRSSLE